MSLVILVALALVAYWLFTKRKKSAVKTTSDLPPKLDRWVCDILERELATRTLGIANSTADERKRLSKTLRGDPDSELVTTIEGAVKSVQLEFMKYAHEQDAEVVVRVTYEDGATANVGERMPLADLPEGVRADFASKGSTRVFRGWEFPWSRIRAS